METEAVILEIRAGAGGDEAALFVVDLFKMYSGFAQKEGFTSTILNSSPTPIGGLKQVSLEISGKNVWNLLKNEGGVHRVQRIPKTEKGGRIHTSTATVAVLKKVSEKEEKIDQRDIRVEFFRSSGPGGQNVNKRETAVRIIHMPTGTVVESQTERGQQSNREYAMSILRSRVAKARKEKERAGQQELRKEQVGSGERSEKIRTYNFPQNRLTDHRIKKSWHNLDSILEGNLGKILSKVSKEIKGSDQ